MTDRLIAQSANNTKPAKLPAINVPRGLDDQLRVVLEAMKERLEVREGSRGNPYERALTLRDVELFKSEAAPAPAPAPAQNITVAGVTETRVKQLVDNALTLEVNTLRASIATVERAQLTLSASAESKTAQEVDKSALSLANSKVGPGTNYSLTGAISVQNTGGLRAGNVTWNPATGAVTGGSGVVLTENGLTGAKAGVVKFLISANGDATFAGDVVTKGKVYAEGSTVGDTQINLSGTLYSINYSSWSEAVTSVATNVVRAGVVGFSNAATSFANVGVLGKGTGVIKGIGVLGDGERFGGYFITTGEAAVEALNTAGGVAVNCDGKFKFGGYTYAVPDGAAAVAVANAAQFMCRNGTWATPFALSGPTTGTATGSFVSTNKPGIASNNSWLTIVHNGTTYYLPAWT